jgi:transposase InsO family protein
MPWKKMLAWVTGQIDDSLRQKLEFVLEENRVYRALLDRHSPQWRLQDAERKALAQKGRPLGKWLATVITIVQPDTLLKWHRRLVAKKWDFSARRTKPLGRPPVEATLEKLVRQLAQDNAGWGYDRIVGALANLGHQVSDQTVGNILRRLGLGPAPERRRQTTWAEFIRRHKDVLWATDFFTSEVWSTSGLVTVYVLFFIHLQTRKIILGGLTLAPNERWVKQIARNVTGVTGPLTNARYLIHDRDAKFTTGFDQILQGVGIQALQLPPHSPNLNAYAERWIRSVKSECLEHLILFGQRSLAYVLREYLAHHHHERNHQGLENVIPFPDEQLRSNTGPIVQSERLGGLLQFYYRKAA